MVFGLATQAKCASDCKHTVESARFFVTGTRGRPTNRRHHASARVGPFLGSQEANFHFHLSNFLPKISLMSPTPSRLNNGQGLGHFVPPPPLLPKKCKAYSGRRPYIVATPRFLVTKCSKCSTDNLIYDTMPTFGPALFRGKHKQMTSLPSTDQTKSLMSCSRYSLCLTEKKLDRSFLRG